MKKRKRRLYVVDLGGDSLYVGSTATTPRERFRRHKAGGKTSVGRVRRRGRRLRQELVGGARDEAALTRRLRREGYRVEGGQKPFCGPRKKRKRAPARRKATK